MPALSASSVRNISPLACSADVLAASTVKLCVLAALVTHKVTYCSPAGDWPADAPGEQAAAGLSPLAGMLQAVSDKAMAKALQRLNWLKVMNNNPF